VVETDIASCFEAIPVEKLTQAVEERVCDQSVLRSSALVHRRSMGSPVVPGGQTSRLGPVENTRAPKLVPDSAVRNSATPGWSPAGELGDRDPVLDVAAESIPGPPTCSATSA